MLSTAEADLGLVEQALAEEWVKLQGSPLQQLLSAGQSQWDLFEGTLTPLQQRAFEAWAQAGSTAAQHVFLVLRNNPDMTFAEVYRTRIDVRQALSEPFSDAAATTHGLIDEAWQAGTDNGLRTANEHLGLMGHEAVDSVTIDDDLRQRIHGDVDKNAAAVRERFEQAAREGDPDQIREALRLVTEDNARRARSSVNVAGTQAYSDATEQAFVQDAKLRGVTTYKLWVTSFSPTTCRTCAALHGTVKRFGEAFPAEAHFGTGSPPRVYGPMLGHPPRHPSCRCRIVYYERGLQNQEEGPTLTSMRRFARNWFRLLKKVAGALTPGLSNEWPEPDDLVGLARTWVPPYVRLNEHGNLEHVDGYWREVKGAEVVYGNELKTDDPVLTTILPLVRVSESTKGEAEIGYIDHKSYIFVGQKFFDLTPAQQRDVLQHEYMHYLGVDDAIVKDIDWDELKKAGKYSYAADHVIEVAADLAQLVYAGKDEEFTKEFPDLRDKVAAIVKMMVPEDIREDAPEAKSPEKPKVESKVSEASTHVPRTSVEAAKVLVEHLHQVTAEKLARYEALDEDEFDGLFKVPPDKPESWSAYDLYTLGGGTLVHALWREQRGMVKERDFEWMLLGVARGEERPTRILVRRYAKDFRKGEVERTQNHELVERAADKVFAEEKMKKMVERYGRPPIYMSLNRWTHGDAGSSETPTAEASREWGITVYETSVLNGTPESRLEGRGFSESDPPPVPGLAVTSESGGSDDPYPRVASVLRHEYGHLVGYALSGGVVPHPVGAALGSSVEWSDKWREFKAKWQQEWDRWEGDMSSEATAARGELNDRILTFYALDDVDEGWAEVFAIVMHPEFDREVYRGVLGEELLDYAIEVLGL